MIPNRHIDCAEFERYLVGTLLLYDTRRYQRSICHFIRNEWAACIDFRILSMKELQEAFLVSLWLNYHQIFLRVLANGVCRGGPLRLLSTEARLEKLRHPRGRSGPQSRDV